MHQRRIISFFLFYTLNLLSSSTLEEAQKFRSEGKKTAALSAFEQLIEQEPNNALAYFEFGMFLAELDEFQYYNKAIYHLKKATDLKFDMQWLFQLGCHSCRFGKLKESIQAYKKILDRHPNQTGVLYNIGFTLKTAGYPKQAIDLYKRVLKAKPDYDPAHLGLAFAYISSGNFKTGWKEHEWNLKQQGKNADVLRTFLSNNDIAGKRILLRPEGGIGDSINFLRYVQRLKHMGAYTIVAIQQPLIPLLSRCNYIDKLITTKHPLPHHDARATLMSLAPIFGGDENNIPQNIPYIFPDPNRIAHWHEKLKTNTDIKVGICWQPDVHNDVSRLPIARRGIPLSYFHKLANTPGVSVYSLQKYEGLNQLQDVPQNCTIHVFDQTFDQAHGAFMDTAAIMHELDLVISTDTATAHLAGAMGKPVWLLLPYATDWRWIVGRKDTPWYPTMRVFKQHKPFDWDGILDELYHIFFKEILA